MIKIKELKLLGNKVTDDKKEWNVKCWRKRQQMIKRKGTLSVRGKGSI